MPQNFYCPMLNYNITPQLAIAYIKGSPSYPNLTGVVYFKDVPGGTEVFTEIVGLPEYQPAKDGKPQIGPHGFHIHEYGNCSPGNTEKPFPSAGSHWNPNNEPHGHHPGDFPVIFSNNGYARMSFFTNRFKVKDVIGKSIIIHDGPDDYKSQPSGNSGTMIACGVIKIAY